MIRNLCELCVLGGKWGAHLNSYDRDFVRSYFPTPATYEQFVLDYEPPASVAEAMRKLTLE